MPPLRPHIWHRLGIRVAASFAVVTLLGMVVQLLNGYLARMTDIVVEHGGTINEFIGDAIFAIFGAPLPYPDHADSKRGWTVFSRH